MLSMDSGEGAGAPPAEGAVAKGIAASAEGRSPDSAATTAATVGGGASRGRGGSGDSDDGPDAAGDEGSDAVGTVTGEPPRRRCEADPESVAFAVWAPPWVGAVGEERRAAAPGTPGLLAALGRVGLPGARLISLKATEQLCSSRVGHRRRVAGARRSPPPKRNNRQSRLHLN
mmetsp:Transcript_100347/g.215033  ORF Transcript_100347/g.215033 Transcript_100347/m.215033 type:complete len:173 (-) Transcript_100347:3-521(-)